MSKNQYRLAPCTKKAAVLLARSTLIPKMRSYHRGHNLRNELKWIVDTLDSTVDMFNGESGSWKFKKSNSHASYLPRSIGFGYLAARTWLLAAFVLCHLAQNTPDSRSTVDFTVDSAETVAQAGPEWARAAPHGHF